VTVDRDRVTAILTLAEAATPGSWESACNALPELCRLALEALDTIDKAKALHWPVGLIAHDGVEYTGCGVCIISWPCPTWQALSGGNE
jgi:hypothetical protein